MLYFHDANLVFLANPKTATTAIEAALGDRADMSVGAPPGLRHMNLAAYRRHVEPLIARHAPAPQVFAVVREPLSRLLSWYRYRMRPHLDGRPESTRGIDVETFLAEVIAARPRPFARIGSQDRFVGLAGGHRPPDHLFPYEDQSPLLAFLRARFGEVSLPRVNVSPSARIDVPDDLAARVRAARAGEVALHDAVRAGRWRGGTGPDTAVFGQDV